MEIEILYGPANAAAKIFLDIGEKCTTESGCMIAMNGNIQVETTTFKRGEGSLLRSFKRFLGGESLFLNHYEAFLPAELWVSTPLPGDMIVQSLTGSGIIVQSGSFVACADAIELDMNWQGIKTLLSGESLFWLRASGHGDVLLGSFGAIYEIAVDGEYIVDTGHIVAFEESLKFSIEKSGQSWVESYLSGEGFVCTFKGKGKLWCQGHNQKSWGMALRPHLRTREAR